MTEHAVILLAEDDEDYVLLIKQAFSKARVPNPLHVVSTGQEAMAYFKGEGKYANREEYPLPDLLLLDLKLPRFNGFEILAWIRTQPGLAGIRVLVLTSSDRIKDVNDAYRLGANSFLVKPYDFEDLVHFTQLIQEFWLQRSKCPDSFRAPKSVQNLEEKVSPSEISQKTDS
jgi:CheY-like chemotaxis protein